MKATWYTSIISGVGFGIILQVFDPETGVETSIISLVFLAFMLVGVVGVSQIRDMFVSRGPFIFPPWGTWGTGIKVEKEDFTKFYLPAWGRMFLWFLSTVITVFVVKSV